MKKIFIAEVQWYDEFGEKDVTDTIVICSLDFVTAMERIEEHYGDTLEAVINLVPVGKSAIINLGQKETNESGIEAAIKCIMENNTF